MATLHDYGATCAAGAGDCTQSVTTFDSMQAGQQVGQDDGPRGTVRMTVGQRAAERIIPIDKLRIRTRKEIIDDCKRLIPFDCIHIVHLQMSRLQR